MERLNKFLLLPKSERWLLVKVTCLLGATHIALRLLPFQRVHRLINRASRKGNQRSNQSNLEAERICRVVSGAGRYFLGNDSCLPQALVGELLLKRRGYEGILRIGVLKGTSGDLRAHAWVERDGVVVIGGPIEHTEKYVPLPDLDWEDL